jgi:hypothetical protein
MSVDQGNWFTNQKEVDAKIQNIAADGGSFTGDVTGDLTGDVSGDVTGDVSGTINYQTVSTYSADGAISLGDDIALLNSSSATAQTTLANQPVGTIRDLVIVARNYTNTMDVDFNRTGVGAVTATFTAAGQSLHLRSAGQSGVGNANWIVVGVVGATIA